MRVDQENNTLVNISNSILKHFNIDTFHDSYKELDKILEKNKDKNICLILLDGFGKVIYETYKEDIPFLYNHIRLDANSVYPPTTVAATTSLMTGKYPKETAFIGWDEHIKGIGYIDIFLNRDKCNKEVLSYINIQKDLLKPRYITDIINDSNNKKIANWISSFNFRDENYHDDFEAFFDSGNKSVKEYKFTYLYSGEPDHTMHEFGVKNEKVREKVIYLNKKVEELTKANPDVLFLVIADHGFKDIEIIYLNHDEELLETLQNKTAIYSVEGTFASFEVKEDKIDDFIKVYNKKYKDKFVLKTKEEIINENWFGIGDPHSLFDSLLGNYFMLSNSKYCFADNDDFKLKATHAGITKEETELNLLVIND